MPLDKDIKKVLIIGSGPIVIGQAAEFDYAGTQACRALKGEGLEIVLVNSNPATIMTDKAMADRIYIEPLTQTTLKRIIALEKPDSMLPTLGGQTGLTLAMQLAKEGFLSRHGVRLLGTRPETIDRAEDRQLFKDTMESIGQPCIPSDVVTDVDAALAFAHNIGYPVIVRPAFTLGGAGGGMAKTPEDLQVIAADGLRLSPISQVLIEKSVAGWKEIEFEVIRDAAGNAITVCDMENVDPVGVHTGDSIVVAPCLTLSEGELQMLRAAALDIVAALQVEGGCNCQFALHPQSGEYAVIEVNPRVSRSSALASKATGYPIAKVAAMIAIGYRLDEIRITAAGKANAFFEPDIDYIALKMPKWPFDKFSYAGRELGTQMKATGEVMALAGSFEMAIMKAVRGAEISLDSLNMPKYMDEDKNRLIDAISLPTDERLFQIFSLLKMGVHPARINIKTGIDLYFLNKLKGMADYENRLADGDLESLYEQGKLMGYPDGVLERISGQRIERPLRPSYRMVDNSAGDSDAVTPYFYSAFGEADEAAAYAGRSDKKRVIVFGSGPIRIGQGIEFDYSSVHCVWSLKKLGYEVIIVNNNPETVSTDFDTADRLYFEPLTKEDVYGIIRLEQPWAVVVAYGGQTAIKLTNFLDGLGVRILGTPADSVDMAEDRQRFEALLNELDIKRPAGATVMTEAQAVEQANALGYPVLVRPSYVLGGQNMSIAFSDSDVSEFMRSILDLGIENPVLIDKYIMGIELEVDAICDGEDILVPGIMEHIERTGIHSGDSIAIYPAVHVDDLIIGRIMECTKKLALAMRTRGLVNIQYILYDDEVYVIEVNPRASRTVPYISKVTGVPMVELATRAMTGQKLRSMGFGTGLYPSSPYTAVKVPVFSFQKLHGVDTHLGPEMKSTGEVLGIGKTLDEALYKGLISAGYSMDKFGGVFITVRDDDKAEIVDVAKKFHRMGFRLYATAGTAHTLRSAGMPCEEVEKIRESRHNPLTLLESGKVNYIISTSKRGRSQAEDSLLIRGLATRLGIPCLTSVDTAMAVANSLQSRYSEINTELVDLNHMRRQRLKLDFVKMQSCGNDYIFFDCFRQHISSPESLSIALADRHYGIGGEGVVLICPSEIADARMLTYNLDGSEGPMCGNAIRCVAKYLYDNDMVPGGNELSIETPGGIRKLLLHTRDGVVSTVRVDMGPASMEPEQVPVDLRGDKVVGRPAEIGGRIYDITCVSMGNPHCVVFTDGLETLDLATIGPQFEHSPLFPKGVNAEFVRVINRNSMRMRVWEQGSGETLACGTGACAAVVAAIENGLCMLDGDIRVQLPGGDLTIRYDGKTVYMTGDANKVYEGSFEL